MISCKSSAGSGRVELFQPERAPHKKKKERKKREKIKKKKKEKKEGEKRKERREKRRKEKKRERRKRKTENRRKEKRTPNNKRKRKKKREKEEVARRRGNFFLPPFPQVLKSRNGAGENLRDNPSRPHRWDSGRGLRGARWLRGQGGHRRERGREAEPGGVAPTPRDAVGAARRAAETSEFRGVAALVSVCPAAGARWAIEKGPGIGERLREPRHGVPAGSAAAARAVEGAEAAWRLGGGMQF